MKEEWRSVVGNPDYEISDCGQVRRAVAGRASAAGKVMRHATMPRGYKVVSLRWPGPAKRRHWLVHRLVALAFLEPVDGCAHVNHKNFDTSDNRVANLEWCTHRQNVDHANAAKRRTPASMAGDKNSNTKLTDDDIRTIRALREAGTRRLDIAARFGITPAQVWVIATRRQWAHVT